MVAEGLRAEPPVSRLRGMLDRLVVQHAGAFVLYQSLWLLLMGPKVLPHFTTRILSSYQKEASLFVWSLEWWSHALTTGSNPLLSTEVWVPTGVNLAWATTSPGPSLLVAPITALLGPVASFNVLSLLIPPVTAWTAYLLARRVTGSVPAALVGGYLFGFSPVVMREIEQGHLNLSALFLLPLAAYLIVRRLDDSMGTRMFVILLTAVLVGQFLIFTEIFATMAVMAALVWLGAMALAPVSMRKPLLQTGVWVALSFGLAAVVVSPYLYTAFAHPDVLKPGGFHGLATGARRAGDLLRFIRPGQGTAIGPPVRQIVSINFWYFGIPLLAVLVAFWVGSWRRYATRVLAFGFLSSVVLALGRGFPVGGNRIPLPWTLFAELPLIGRARPGRLVAYGFLFASVSAALWVASTHASTLRSAIRWVLVGAAALAIFPNFWADIWVSDVSRPPFFSTGQYRQYLCPGETVMIMGPDGEQLFWQATTGMYFRTAGWYGGFRPEDYSNPRLAHRLTNGAVRPTDGNNVREFLAEHGVTAILVDRPGHAAYQLGDILQVRPQLTGGVFLLRLADC